ncbi:MAG: sigma-54 dependent transcriptional regulator [Rhodanobacter sp.]
MPQNPPFDLCLIVDDDDDVVLAARMIMRDLFRRVETAGNPHDALAMFAHEAPDLVLLDANFTRGATDAEEGLALIAAIRERDPDAAIVMITAHGSVSVAVEAMKRGVTDFVIKPWDNARLLAIARTAAEVRRSRRNASRGQDAVAVYSDSRLLSQSPTMARVHSLIEKAAPTDANILLLGENGTGKDIAAREIHRLSRRAHGPLQTIDLGAIAETLFDAELFGVRKGAFTDAKADRVGRMQAAAGGSLFLDEIGNLPRSLQPKLLTVLEQRAVTPVGATEAIPIDIRVIAATNLAPEHLSDPARFRQDLLFRLNTVEIHLPALRERREDIPLLLNHFLGEYEEAYHREKKPVPSAVMSHLVARTWLGNVRALRHAAERAVILSQNDTYVIEDFAPGLTGAVATVEPASPSADDGLNLDRAERRLIERALTDTGYNISKAAEQLGLTRASLYRRMEKHGL